ncbi:permease [Planctomycetales bacterium]|nr:permease [Planctomycetales bacterium]
MSQGSYNQNMYNEDFYAPTDLFAAAADAQERSTFITKTYSYLFGAVCALIAIEVVLFNTVNTSAITQIMMGGQISWLIVLGLFMAVSWIANSWALNSTSSAMQHAGLVLYIVAQSIILMPLLCITFVVLGPEQGLQTIQSAGLATGGLFALMTFAVFITRKDFSFLRSFLVFGSLAALGFIFVAILFGFSIGPIFMYAMIALMCGYILYDTSNVMHHYRTTQYVAASLALFASVVLLFWYVLQLFLSNRD